MFNESSFDKALIPVYVGVVIKFLDDEKQNKYDNKTIKIKKDGFMKPNVVKNFMYNSENYDAKLVSFDKDQNFEIKITGKIKGKK